TVTTPWCPPAWTRSTANPVSRLWNVTRSITPVRVSGMRELYPPSRSRLAPLRRLIHPDLLPLQHLVHVRVGRDRQASQHRGVGQKDAAVRVGQGGPATLRVAPQPGQAEPQQHPPRRGQVHV